MSNEFLERVFMHPDMSKIPLGTQATALHVFQEVLEDMVKENPNADVQSLLSAK
jgi:hypothetical protein